MNEPPFRTRNSTSPPLTFRRAGVDVHSRTLPPIPYTPKGLGSLGRSVASTRDVPGARLLWSCQYSRLLQWKTFSCSEKRLPQGYSRRSGPRAATSHSSPVGRRLPAHLA